jgi:signal peptide peptidase SppA
MQLTPALRFLTNQHWAMVPDLFDAMTGIIERHAAGEKASGAEDLFGDRAEEPRMQVIGSVGVIAVRGVTARYADQVNGMCQRQGRSAESLQADLNRAANDPSIKTIVLRIDSPGGTVAGTAETADLVRGISARGKPVVAYVDGLAASAALWLASQADEIVASSPASEIGSLGVMTAHIDVSRQAEARGMKVQIFRSVALKAPGAMGETLNSDQQASIQRMLGELHDAFATAVQAGRGLTDAQRDVIANGETWTAGRAISLGLVDRISAWDDLVAELNGAPATISLPHRSVRPAAAHQGAQPVTAAAPAAEPSGDPMKVTASVLAAIVAAHPTHAAHIATRATAGAEESEIRAEISARDRQATEAQVTALTGEIASLKASHATVLAAEQAAHAATKASLADMTTKHAKLAGLAPKHGDVGDSDPSKVVAKTATAEEFEAMSGSQKAAFHAAKGVITGVAAPAPGK